MMRRMGWMTTVMIACLCCVGAAASAASKSDGLDGLVRAVDTRYHVKGKRVPMMWAVSLIARGASRNGVRGLRVVTYEQFPGDVDRSEMEGMMRSKLGPEWSPMVRSVRRGSGEDAGEISLVYARPEGRWMRMVVMTLEGHELDMVGMEMNPEALARWERAGH